MQALSQLLSSSQFKMHWPSLLLLSVMHALMLSWSLSSLYKDYLRIKNLFDSLVLQPQLTWSVRFRSRESQVVTYNWFQMFYLHYRNTPDSGIQHSHLCNEYGKGKLKVEVIFMSHKLWLITSVSTAHHENQGTQGAKIVTCINSYLCSKEVQIKRF